MSQYWKACTKVMLRMPPDVTFARTTAPTMTGTDPGRGARRRAQRDARALELREQVEPADRDHHQRADGAHPREPSRASAGRAAWQAPDRRSGAATRTRRAG